MVRHSATPALLALVVVAVSLVDVQAQPVVGFPGSEPSGTYPNEFYYVALQDYRNGDLELAMDRFDVALGRCRRDINGRWIDSIPVLAMTAECHWHAGNLPACRAALDQVFQLVARHRGWLGRVDWDQLVQPGAVRSPTRGLWPEAAAVRVLTLSRKTSFLSGEQATEQRIAQGGSFEQLNIKSIDAVEVMRGIALASFRRRVLMGPLSNQDPLGTDALESTKYPSELNSVLGKTLIGSMRACERLGVMDDGRVMSDVSKYSTVQGGVHPLAGALMLCDAYATAGTDNWSATPAKARMTANAAAALEQPELVGEAAQLAAGCATSANAVAVATFCKTAALAIGRESRLAALHCLVAAADAAVTAGDAASALELIRQAQTLSSRRDVVQPRIDAYGAYVASRLAALQGTTLQSTGSGASKLDQSLASLSKFALNHSFGRRSVTSMPRVSQLSLIVQATTATRGATAGDEALQRYCAAAPAEVWRRDPVDAMAITMLDKSTALDLWLRLAANDTDGREFLRRLDVVLADRFLRHLPLGGRIAQVRQLATAPETILPTEAVKFLADAGPVFDPLRNAAGQAVPLDADAATVKGNQQEVLATQIALNRGTLPRVIPAPADPTPLADQIPAGRALVTFTRVGTGVIATLTFQGETDIWAVAGANRLGNEVAMVLREIGAMKSRGKRLPENDNWKSAAGKLAKRLFPDSRIEDLKGLQEVVIVPDGLLWYLPFELLPVDEADDVMLGDALSVRYATTPGSAFHPTAPTAANGPIAFVGGSFFQPQDRQANEAAIESVLGRLEQSRRLGVEDKMPSGLLGDSVSVLAVAAAKAPDLKRPLAFNVGAYDGASPMGSLDGWMRLPGPSPRSVVLAGFRTPVGVGKLGGGDELFMTITALQAAGVRDVMITRWAVGGQSTATALSELLPEIPFLGLVGAWQRAKSVLKETELDPAAEPLIPQSEHKREGVTGGQPLFWAGYLLASPTSLQPPPSVPQP
ncbi:CHAT domain-containing protein [Crateriforma spongiae]|uniref:CHAT domain-containing protein n=1 Tax=Crateriforma spongiae TaxID=2724528 RepID=UPI001446325A|nr:CHAT domain-containing protein [Crateriforma spongiae]